jgi:hypothetical protein
MAGSVVARSTAAAAGRQGGFAFDPTRHPLYRRRQAKLQTIAGVLEILPAAILAGGLIVAAFAVFGSRLLLGWYLHEVRGLRIPEEPDEAIVTYPLA